MLIHWYRIANWLHRHHVPILPKLIYFLQYILFNSSVPYSCMLMGGGKIRLWRYCYRDSCQSCSW